MNHTIIIFFLSLVSFQYHSQTVIYKGKYGYDAIAHIDDGVIYKGKYGYDALVHIDDGVIYKGKYGYDAIAHIDGYLSDIQLFAVLILILDL